MSSTRAFASCAVVRFRSPQTKFSVQGTAIGFPSFRPGVKRQSRTKAMACSFQTSKETSGASKLRGRPFSSTSKDTTAQACRPTAARIRASSIAVSSAESAMPEPSGYFALRNTGREAPSGGSNSTPVRCQRDCFSGKRKSTGIGMAGPGIAPGVKRRCATASSAFSSSPRPSGCATCKLLGVPSAAMVPVIWTVPSRPARRASAEYSGFCAAASAASRANVRYSPRMAAV